MPPVSLSPGLLRPSRPRPSVDSSTASLSVVVPIFNEAATLGTALEAFCSIDLPIPFEIICVDDGSTDGSVEVLRSFADRRIVIVESPENGGKGSALRKGFERASGDYVLIQDADLEYDPREWHRLLEPVLRGDTRVVFGSRFLGERSGMKLHSYIANRGLTMMTKVLFGSAITDMETCYKLIDRQLLLELPLSANRFDFEPQITAMLLQRGERIVEVPITYRGRDKAAGKKIGFRDGMEAVAMLIRCARQR